MFQNNLLMAAASTASAGGFSIDNSVRYNDDDSPGLTRTNSVGPTDASKGIIGGWFKSSNIGITRTFWTCAGSAFEIDITVGDAMSCNVDGGYQLFATTKLFRDPTAWYQVVCSYDSDESSADDRFNIYINGIKITSFSYESFTRITSAEAWSFTADTIEVSVGISYNGVREWDGYLAQQFLLDGVSIQNGDHAITDLAEFGDNGVWRPVDLSGLTFGNNGWLLDFADSSALGNDVSGNDNDFASSGLDANDQMTDTPTKNWCTFNGAAAYSSTLSNGNLRGVSGAAAGTCVASMAVSSGKWYFEMTMDEPNVEGQSARVCYISQSNTRFSYPQNIHGDATTLDGQFSGYWGYNGKALDNYTAYPGRTYGDIYTDGDVVSCALDLDNMAVWWGVNGTWQDSATEAEIEAADTSNAAQTGLAEGVWFFVFQGASTIAVIANFGQFSYAHSVPDGFLDMNTANITTPAVLDGTANFQPTLYTGDGSTRNIDQTENSTFQPDWVWIKNRSQADSNMLFDAARGVTKVVNSDNYAAETTDTNSLTSFDSDGFGLGTGAGGYNDDTESFVAWQWLAGGGAGSSNEDGSINTTTTTVNTTAGISISTYVGTGSVATIGHGLGVIPQMIIIFYRDSASYSRRVYHSGVLDATDPQTDRLLLDSTAAAADDAAAWNDTAPTSTVFSIGAHDGVNASSGTYVAYAFANVEGFSCFGSYRGNQVAANGPIVYTGFKPAYVMIKNSTGTGNWFIYDSQRSPYNEIDDQLLVNTNAAETTGSEEIDFLASGFKIQTNDSEINWGYSYYIYAAFAEYPFGGDGATPATSF